MGGKPKVMQVLDVYHFGETHEHGYGADKPRNIIGANRGFEPTIIGFWRAQGTQHCTANRGALDDWATRAPYTP